MKVPLAFCQTPCWLMSAECFAFIVYTFIIFLSFHPERLFSYSQGEEHSQSQVTVIVDSTQLNLFSALAPS